MTTLQEPLAGPGFPPFLNTGISSPESPVAPASLGAQPDREAFGNAPSAESNSSRCQFSFSDGRHCRMPRAQGHASLCSHHASREEAERGSAIPELVALAGEFTTATDINRAMTQVFRLLAQGRISRRDALAFGSLARLLLQTVRGVRGEFVSAFGFSAWNAKLRSKLEPSAGENFPAPNAAQQQPSASRQQAKQQANQQANQQEVQRSAPRCQSFPARVAIRPERPPDKSQPSLSSPAAVTPAAPPQQKPQPPASAPAVALTSAPPNDARSAARAQEAKPKSSSTPGDDVPMFSNLTYIGPLGPVTERVLTPDWLKPARNK